MHKKHKNKVSGIVNPNVANAGGLQSPGVKGEEPVVVFYFEPLTTQNLKFSDVPEG